jgi:hypothetical protein
MRKFDNSKRRKKLNQEAEFVRGGRKKKGDRASGGGEEWGGVGVSDTLVTLSG